MANSKGGAAPIWSPAQFGSWSTMHVGLLGHGFIRAAIYFCYYLSQKESAEQDRQGKAAKANGKAPTVEQPVLTPPAEQTIQRSSPRDRSKVQCYHCHGCGHTALECPLRRAATEARGSGGTHSGSSPAVIVERSEDLGDYCQRLRQEWVEADFSRLAGAYCPEALVDTVDGAL